jgi:hypothetical protein
MLGMRRRLSKLCPLLQRAVEAGLAGLAPSPAASIVSTAAGWQWVSNDGAHVLSSGVGKPQTGRAPLGSALRLADVLFDSRGPSPPLGQRRPAARQWPLASVTPSSPHLVRAAVAEGIGSAGAPVQTDLAVLDAKHWVEMRMGSQVFVSQHASTPHAETGYICGHEQRASCRAPTQPCHRPLPGWHGRLLVWCSRQYERVAIPDSSEAARRRCSKHA